MAKYINPDKIINLIDLAKIQFYTDSYQYLLNNEYGLDQEDCHINEFIRILIKCLEYEFELDNDSEITYDLYMKLSKYINTYNFDNFTTDQSLQYSGQNYIFIGEGKIIYWKDIKGDPKESIAFIDFINTTIVNVDLLNNEEEVILDWSNHILKHGIKPSNLLLYERNTQYNSKCTSPDYTENNGLTYKWYVGLNSPRQWEIRIEGYAVSTPIGSAIYYGTTDSILTDILQLINTSVQDTIELNTGTNNRFFHIAIPPNVTLEYIADLDAGIFENITTSYEQKESIEFQGLSYKVYTLELSIPYSTNHKHQFKLS